MAEAVPRISSQLFNVEDINIAATVEQIVRGGRDKFDLVKRAFAHIQQVGVIGYKSQGPAHAQNLRETLGGTAVQIVVGLKPGSPSREVARKDGFTEENGTLGDTLDVIRSSDFVLLLIDDEAQVNNYQSFIDAMKPGATLGFAHGFLYGYLQSIGVKFRPDINIIAACPKGMGPSVRRLYVQGRHTNGAGINSSIAFLQTLDQRAVDLAIGWAIGIGSPFVFVTTLLNEEISDLSGERGVLLGGVRGLLEGDFSYIAEYQGRLLRTAFQLTAEALTGPITWTISKEGLLALSRKFEGSARKEFFTSFTTGYQPYKRLIAEIYDEVKSGNEIRSVLMTGRRITDPATGQKVMSKIENTLMWYVGKAVRADRKERALSDEHARIAGLYVAMMLAQVDVLYENGHSWTEICNETVIEAVDSLTPFMDSRGVDFMVDNCSITARIGTRKWSSRFTDTAAIEIYPSLSTAAEVDDDWVDQAAAAFAQHAIHQALDVCRSMRPTLDIAVA